MKELVLVGRGGQGVVLASQILADTFARAGFFAQSFPEFKAERRGAPISAFLRWDDEPIHRRYKVRECDVLVVVSAAPPTPELLDSVRPGGLVVLNRESRFPAAGSFHIARVPGSRIARAHGILSAEGRPMGNVAVLGACVRLLLPGGLEFLEQAVSARLGTLAGPNLVAAREGYEHCTRQHALAGDVPVAATATAPGPPPDAVFPISVTTCRSNRTGSWSEEQPVLTDECTACALCALFCPEGAISRVDGHMLVDAEYCKGCGICEVVCPVRGAVHMEEVTA
jgi:pyruvate ferredoxin oxidoreductase gamma subunit